MWASEEHRRLQASLLQVSHNNLPWLKINESIFQTFWKEEDFANIFLWVRFEKQIWKILFLSEKVGNQNTKPILLYQF